MKCIKCKQTIPSESVFCLHCGYEQKRLPQKRSPKTRPNGSGTVFKRDNGWRAEVTLGYTIDKDTGKKKAIRRTKSGFKTKREALDFLPELRDAGFKSRSQVETLATLWEGYKTSAMLELANGSQQRHRRTFRKLQSIAYIPIANLTIHSLQSHVDHQADTYYPAREMRDLLSLLYQRAVAQGDVPTNIAPYIILPAKNEKEAQPFTGPELLTLWEDYENGTQFTGYILFLIYSGTMPVELFGMSKEMIDWENRRIVGAGRKTKKRRETPIVIAELILPVLKDLCNASTSTMVLDMRHEKFYEEFQDTMDRLHIKNKRPYDCRHTTATALDMAGIPPETIKSVMRHTKFDTTKKYIHSEVDVSPLLDAVNRITKNLL